MFIISSAGLNSTETKIKKMILAGTDIIRFNFSRRDLEENIKFIKITQKIIEELNSDTKIMADMPINKIRLGDFDIKTFAVRENEEFMCKSASYTADCNQFIPINVSRLGEKVFLNQIITIGDGEIAIQVINIEDYETIKIKILNNGIINYFKTFNINCELDEEKIINIYQEIIEKINDLNIDFIAVSYFNKETNKKIKNILSDVQNKHNDKKFIIKIENQTAANDIDHILEDKFFNMILLDRGELGVNMPFEKIGIIQKKISAESKKNNKILVVSTQILESTIKNYIPARSDVLDLTNLIIDGVQGIMLCHETGLNTRPAYTLSVAKKIISAVEEYKKNKL